MAEVVGLIASLSTLAGASATLSVKLYEYGSTWKAAYSDLNDLASDVADLSSVLESLGEVLETHQARIVPRTVQDLQRQTKRCEAVIEQLKITAELTKRKSTRVQWLFRKSNTLKMQYSLEGFKTNMTMAMITVLLSKSLEADAAREQDPMNRRTSAATRRNISRLKSAVMSNAKVVEKLKEAEKQTTVEDDSTSLDDPIFEALPSRPSRPYRSSANSSWTGFSPYEPPSSPNGPASEAKQAKDHLRRDIESTRASMGLSTMIVGDVGKAPTWETVLLRSYDQLSKEPPASETLILLPWHDTHPVSQTQKPSMARQPRPDRNVSGSSNREEKIPVGIDGDEKVGALLQEWTKTSSEAFGILKGHEEDQSRPVDVPSWVPEEYTFRGGNESDPTCWEPNPEQPARPAPVGPVIRTAYDANSNDEQPMCDVLASKGGGYVWRHDDGSQRDYYVGHQKVLEYKIKPQSTSPSEELTINRTILSKQWISKAVLDDGGYNFKDFGEGGWAVQRKLTPSEVHDLHVQASNRTEKLLRRLAQRNSSTPTERPRRYAFAMHTFVPQNADLGEMPFKAGETLSILDTEGEWWSAELNGRTGRIPANFVKLLTGSQGLALAIHTFANPNLENGELAFSSGTLLYLLETEGDWWLASYNGKTGKIPKSYVKVMSDLSESEQQASTPSPGSKGAPPDPPEDASRSPGGSSGESPETFDAIFAAQEAQSPPSNGIRLKTQPSAFRMAMEGYFERYGKGRGKKG